MNIAWDSRCLFPGTLYLLSARTDRVEHSDNTSSSSLEREREILYLVLRPFTWSALKVKPLQLILRATPDISRGQGFDSRHQIIIYASAMGYATSQFKTKKKEAARS